MKCPLCHHSQSSEYYRDKRRAYLQCGHCDLVFVPSEYHLPEELEKREYDLHENDPEDHGYRRFLSRLADPLLERLTKKSWGLDFGCGPGPALAAMMSEAGHSMALYDLFYYKNEDVWKNTYDFICATEVLEHLGDPAGEIFRLVKHLRPKGILAIMTKQVRDRDSFSRWHYIQDPTHISFFSISTFEYLAERFNCKLYLINKDVVFLRKND